MIDLEQLKNNVRILDVAKDLGLTPVRVGSYYTLKEHDSVRIRPNENIFYRNSNNAQGSVIDFVMEFSGLDFNETIKTLAGVYDISNLKNDNKSKVSYKKPVKVKKELVLPERAETTKNVYAYLTRTRGIDSEIVNRFIDSNNIYQDRRNNCVFVSYSNNEPKFACFRGTTPKRFLGDVEGSDYDHCFFVDNNSKTLTITESVIDSLSVMSLTKINGFNYNDMNYLALSGVTKYEQALKYHFDKQEYDLVYIALDNDNAGRDAADKIKNFIAEKYTNCKCVINLPKNQKDFNDKLLELRNETSIEKEEERSLVMSNKLVISGFLRSDVKSQDIELKSGDVVLRSAAKVNIPHGKGKPATTVNVEAWNDNAKDLLNYKKSDKITLVAHMKEVKFDDGRMTIFVTDKIDKTNTIDKQIDQLLNSYCDSSIEQIASIDNDVTKTLNNYKQKTESKNIDVSTQHKENEEGIERD